MCVCLEGLSFCIQPIYPSLLNKSISRMHPTEDELDLSLNSIEEGLEALRKGQMIIVVDDEDRENEGDFIIPVRFVTPEVINFMAKVARGLICVALTEQRCDELDLKLMVEQSNARHETAFTVSIDYLKDGCTTGISVEDRSKTILALINPVTVPGDFARPGHVFPLRAKPDGVLRRTGHTEAAVDLARLAGYEPAGVIVEIMNEDGTMARLPQLKLIAKQYNMPIISIAQLIKYRMVHETIIQRVSTVKMPTAYGDFTLHSFVHKQTGETHLALVKGLWDENEPVLTRVHSSCLTGDVFGSLRCDCGEQLHTAMKIIEQAGKGVILYMNQEGRGIGLVNKLKAYELQEQGLDTVEANIHLGYKMDQREYGIGAQILRNLMIRKIKLLSNNPNKKSGLTGYGIEIVEQVPIKTTPNQHNYKYLKTKNDKMGHDLGMSND
jgi:3,4-dihydroxy 2-butanone 4-phosphate synthase / GTP cyclohydrolase II